MPARLERRSARILALILAFIMLGSVFAYMSGGGKNEKREIKLYLQDFRDWIKIAPEGGGFFYYNITELSILSKKLGNNDPLVNLTQNELYTVLRSPYLDRRVIELTHGVEELMLAEYSHYPVYFINDNASRVYFAKESDYKVGNLTVQFSRYGIAMVSETSPLIVGYAPIVLEIAKYAEKGIESNYSNYINRVNDTFVFAFITFGNESGKYLQTGETNQSFVGIVDFLFQGFRYNFTSNQYEKVLGIHFTENYFFYHLNETEKDFEYYYFDNFGDGFSLAVMGDKDFTKTLKARPNILGLIIKEVNES
ncbi:MAG: hypothetical protein QXN34_07335 [Archaeoglobaceae archaeon]